MSSLTTQLRYILEESAGYTQSPGFNGIDEVIDKARPKIFSFDYPVFDEKYKEHLEKQILLQYYMREIGLETPGRWKLALMQRLRLIMPYYNGLYKSTLFEFNPLYDVDMETMRTTTTTGTQDGKTERENKTESETGLTTKKDETASSTNKTQASAANTSVTTDKNAYSDTPQGSLSNVVGNTYLTDYRKIDSEGEAESESEESTTGSMKNNTQQTSTENSDIASNEISTSELKIENLDDYIEHVKGKTGGRMYGEMIKDFRSTFINIDKMIIDELKDLFSLLWEVSE